MVLREMLFEFEQMLETTSPILALEDRPDTETMIEFLNMGQLRLIRDRYLQGPTLQDNIARIMVSSDDLQKLIVEDDTMTFSMESPEHYQYRVQVNGVPDDLLHYVRSASKATRTGYGAYASQWVDNTVGDLSVVDTIMVTPHNSPLLLHPVVILSGDGIMWVYIDSSTTILGMSLTYLKKPDDFDIENMEVGCQLAPYLHKELVRLSYEMYLVEYKLRLRQKADDSKGNAT